MKPKATSSGAEASQNIAFEADAETRHTPQVTVSLGNVALVGESSDSVTAAKQQGKGAQKTVRWQAEEYISADKNPLWYVGLVIVVLGAIVLDIFFLKTYFTVSILAIVMAVVLVVMHVRPARMIHYELNVKGMVIDERLFPLGDYKSFGIAHDGKENSIYLMPIKRFRPSLQVYFPIDARDAIVEMLGDKLPMEEVHSDFIDTIVRWLRL